MAHGSLSDTLSLAPTTPTLVSLTIPADGTTAEAVFSEAMAIGAGGAGGWTLNDPMVAMTRTGGTGTVEDPVIFSLARTVLSTATENPYASYTQPTNGFESADEGVDLASIPSASVTNNSTQSAESCLTEAIDQEYSETNKDINQAFTTAARGFSFTPSVTGSLSSISFYSAVVSTPGNVTVRIGTGPDLSTYHEEVVVYQDTANIFVNVKLTTPMPVTSGTVYYVGMIQTSGSTRMGLDMSSPTYSGGSYYEASSGWAMLAKSIDEACFKSYMCE